MFTLLQISDDIHILSEIWNKIYVLNNTAMSNLGENTNLMFLKIVIEEVTTFPLSEIIISCFTQMTRHRLANFSLA